MPKKLPHIFLIFSQLQTNLHWIQGTRRGTPPVQDSQNTLPWTGISETLWAIWNTSMFQWNKDNQTQLMMEWLHQPSNCGSDWPDGHTSHYESYHSEVPQFWGIHGHWGLKEWLPSFGYFGIRTWWYLPTHGLQGFQFLRFWRMYLGHFFLRQPEAIAPWRVGFCTCLSNLGPMQKLVFQTLVVFRKVLSGLQISVYTFQPTKQRHLTRLLPSILDPYTEPVDAQKQNAQTKNSRLFSCCISDSKPLMVPSSTRKNQLQMRSALA